MRLYKTLVVQEVNIMSGVVLYDDVIACVFFYIFPRFPTSCSCVRPPRGGAVIVTTISFESDRSFPSPRSGFIRFVCLNKTGIYYSADFSMCVLCLVCGKREKSSENN